MHASAAQSSRPPPGGTRVSVIVPVFNGGDDLRRCLEAVMASRWGDRECLVVDDGSTDGRATELAERYGARLLRRPRQQGPAAARNAGAAAATGDILFFVDADVVLQPDAIGLAVEALQADPAVGAVFGSYDECPDAPELLSRYRNLYHYWNHQSGNEEASTFWTGCGAVRRGLFLSLGGFSESFERPSIEDIEFGYRLRSAGHRIRLLKGMQGKHLKRWGFANMVYTDLFLRGIPWVVLLQRFEDVPADLNLGWKARLATAGTGLLLLVMVLLTWLRPAALLPLLGLLAACLAAGLLARRPSAGGRAWRSGVAVSLALALPLVAALAFPEPWALAPLGLVAVVVGLQWDFYRLLERLHGFAFALAAVPLQLLFFVNCGLAVPLGLASHQLSRKAKGPAGRT